MVTKKEAAQDRAAVKLSLEDMAKDAIIGIFGPADNEQMLGRMFSVIDFAENLRIDDLTVSVTLKELIKARKEYLKTVYLDEE
jgi:hypothetical protein